MFLKIPIFFLSNIHVYKDQNNLTSILIITAEVRYGELH